MDNPGKNLILLAYVDLRKIEYAKKISEILAGAKNTILLDSNILQLNMTASPPKK